MMPRLVEPFFEVHCSDGPFGGVLHKVTDGAYTHGTPLVQQIFELGFKINGSANVPVMVDSGLVRR